MKRQTTSEQLLILRKAVIDFAILFAEDILKHPISWMIWLCAYLWIWTVPYEYIMFWIVIFGVGLLVGKVEDK
jgi:hypothetical protein